MWWWRARWGRASSQAAVPWGSASGPCSSTNSTRLHVHMLSSKFTKCKFLGEAHCMVDVCRRCGEQGEGEGGGRGAQTDHRPISQTCANRDATFNRGLKGFTNMTAFLKSRWHCAAGTTKPLQGWDLRPARSSCWGGKSGFFERGTLCIQNLTNRGIPRPLFVGQRKGNIQELAMPGSMSAGQDASNIH